MNPMADRRRVALGALSLMGGGLLASGGRAQTGAKATAPTPSGSPAAPDVIQSQTDADDRMTVKVMVNGQGPYPFVVDTGAERSAISAELAAELMLPPGAPMVVHGVAGQIVTPSTLVAELGVGSRRLKNLTLPLLARSNIGAAGVLGIDAVQGQKVELDFFHREIRVRYSAPTTAMHDEIVVSARSRFGQLVLVDSYFENSPILVVVDTGAEKSIGNLALRRRLHAETMDLAANAAMIYSVTGQTTEGQWALINNVHVGGFGINRLPVVFSELHAFARWRLQDQPALLLGMDVLRQFDQVDIDFSRREVRFRGALAAEGRRPATLARLG